MICITFQLPSIIQHVTPIISLKTKHTTTEGKESNKIEENENPVTQGQNNSDSQPNLKKQRLD